MYLAPRTFLTIGLALLASLADCVRAQAAGPLGDKTLVVWVSPATLEQGSGSALTVVLPGNPNHPRLARLTGDARFIFEGTLDPEATAGGA